MNFSHFVRIERVVDGRLRHFVVHMHDPKFALELTPDTDAPDKIGGGVMKSLHVPNSWAGNYSQYAKFVAAAQEFFRRSSAEAASKDETRRFQL